MRTASSYLQVLRTFARNSFVRDTMFRTNFVLECVSSVSWTLMNVGFYLIVFHHTPLIGPDSGWGKYQFFVFLGTTWLINSLVQTFFMTNADDYSELIRTGNLDFALLKPIDTQFLVSFQKVDWSALSNFAAGLILLAVSLWHLTTRPTHPLVITPWAMALYVVYVLCGVAVRFLVLHHELRPLPDGDLQPWLGCAAVGAVHLRRAGTGGRQCSRTDPGAAAVSRAQSELAVGGLCAGRDWRESGRVPLGISAGLAELPQRQQLTLSLPQVATCGGEVAPRQS